MITEKINYWVMPGLLKKPQDDAKFPSLDKIMNYVADYYEIPDTLIKSNIRKQEIVLARQMYCWLCRMLTRKSHTDIGALIGKDHATVIHSFNTINNYIYTKHRRGDGANRLLNNIKNGN